MWPLGWPWLKTRKCILLTIQYQRCALFIPQTNSQHVKATWTTSVDVTFTHAVTRRCGSRFLLLHAKRSIHGIYWKPACEQLKRHWKQRENGHDGTVVVVEFLQFALEKSIGFSILNGAKEARMLLIIFILLLGLIGMSLPAQNSGKFVDVSNLLVVVVLPMLHFIRTQMTRWSDWL